MTVDFISVGLYLHAGCSYLLSDWVPRLYLMSQAKASCQSVLQVSDEDRVSDREDEANPREAEQAGDHGASGLDGGYVADV